MAPVWGQQRKNSFLLVLLVLSAVLLDALTTPECVSPALGECLGCSLTQCLSLREIGYSGKELTEVSAALEVVKNEPGYGN